MTPKQLARFEAKYVVDPNSGCWLWDAGLNAPDGYGQMRSLGGRSLAHRASYEHFVGPIPDGLYVCHRCDVKACVNPAHLFVGTQLDNVRDAIAKGIKVGAPLGKPHRCSVCGALGHNRSSCARRAEAA